MNTNCICKRPPIVGEPHSPGCRWQARISFAAVIQEADITEEAILCDHCDMEVVIKIDDDGESGWVHEINGRVYCMLTVATVDGSNVLCQ